ncbi:R.Pab1 family restriction endonuclease [Campylobacter troglodytis]|uniref:R.Pab1 family restriction endonuclease n=1 Tax=Campylobacter troglodytis TaxID=654363 RepID=UPI00115753E7|nr:R.Pab1 family restriction endonuclease [Campylobacter troglodytis]TQR60466.1 restriction endonuclease [Campylobacter troglodytis]
MKIAKLQKPQIVVELPLTTQSSKVRVKERNSFYEYGLPISTRQVPFAQKHYIEWQIGYDADKSDKEKLALTKLQESEFFRAKDKDTKKPRALYELSEYLFYFAYWGIVSVRELDNLLDFLEQVSYFLDSRFEIRTQELQPLFQSHYSSMFSLRTINLPYLIWRNKESLNDRFSIEIIIKEKQNAVGIQPMLYVCFPITHLEDKYKQPLLGRVAGQNECAYLILDYKDKEFVLEAFKILGILSPDHNCDTREILAWIRANWSF